MNIDINIEGYLECNRDFYKQSFFIFMIVTTLKMRTPHEEGQGVSGRGGGGGGGGGVRSKCRRPQNV